MAARKPKIEIWQAMIASGKLPAVWRWHLTARNGEIQCPSEGYTTRAGAIRGALAAQRNFSNAEIVEVE